MHVVPQACVACRGCVAAALAGACVACTSSTRAATGAAAGLLGAAPALRTTRQVKSASAADTECAGTWEQISRARIGASGYPRAVSAVAARLDGSAAAAEGALVLGIESSCDDTGVAVVRASDGAILGQVRLLSWPTGPVPPYSAFPSLLALPCECLWGSVFAVACLQSPGL